MEKVKRLIFLNVPMSICNFRCSYCYLAQRKKHYQNKQPQFQYSPEHVGQALSKERLGGTAFINICADGETLLTKDIDKYTYQLLKAGHYIEFITNLSVSKILDKMLLWDRDLLKRLEFKCSFHYLQLKEKGLLDIFADNVHKIWAAGASANIEITPSDDLIPYIDEVKKFSIEKFGALPHITIARNDNSSMIEYLTTLEMEDYDKIWSTFDSDFWKFKKTIFNKKRKEFCYAGDWSLLVKLDTGQTYQCYRSRHSTNIFKDIDKPIDFRPIGKCTIPHCYNGHAFLTLGCIPSFTNVKYGNIRNRIKQDGGEWLQSDLKAFFNSTLMESNSVLTDSQRKKIQFGNIFLDIPLFMKKRLKRIITGGKW